MRRAVLSTGRKSELSAGPLRLGIGSFDDNSPSPASRRRSSALLGPLSNQVSLHPGRGLTTMARELARSQQLVESSEVIVVDSLLERLQETQDLLNNAFVQLEDKATGNRASPASEWLLDNYHLIHAESMLAAESLPVNFYRELPKLSNGAHRGYPRVYEIALEFISGSTGVVTMDALESFTREYQRISMLSMGELWALPSMLRMALIGNIWRTTKSTTERLVEIVAADEWVERITRDAESINASVRAFLSDHPPLTAAFCARFFSIIRTKRSAATPISALERFVIEEGVDIEACARSESAKAAVSNVIMQNSVTSLRALQQLDWRKFFERHSMTEGILRHDPAQVYAEMTFSSRDSYRHAVEQLARGSKHSEEEVARRVVSLANGAFKEWKAKMSTPLSSAGAAATAVGPDEPEAEPLPGASGGDAVPVASQTPLLISTAEASARSSPPARAYENVKDLPREAHVGYWLVDDGRKDLERVLETRLQPLAVVMRYVKEHPFNVYFGSISLFSLAFLIMVAFISPILSLALPWWLFVPLVLLLVTDAGIQITHVLVTKAIPPRVLPMMDFTERPLPAVFRSMVVVPLLVTSVQSAEEHVDQLEVQFLANRDSNILFGLLTDFADAPSETMPQDSSILKAATRRVVELNNRYPEKCFFLLHRPRKFNSTQGRGVWMGWERKRGKLEEFNEYLLHPSEETRGAFSKIVGDEEKLRTVRYVITLDADTVLPRDAAKTMIGAMAHPLNRAVIDPELRRVVKGYGVMQPRVSTRLVSNCTEFAAIMSGRPGIDPYVNAVSDVYQDLFSEGSFTGKGIYDVEAFMASTRGRFLPNTVLSHDLIEGSYARSALLTNVEVFDDFPSKYIAYTKRKHRWIRGDWQLLRWVIGFATAPAATRARIGHISLLSRWKLFDNLRRTVYEVALFALFASLWLLTSSGEAFGGTLLALFFTSFPWLLSFVLSLVPIYKPLRTSYRAFYLEALRDGKKSLLQFAYALVFIPHQAVTTIDAIVRVMWRLRTKRDLLEWTVMSTVEATTRVDSLGSWIQMWDAEAAVAAVTMLLVFVRGVSVLEFLVIVPVLAAWALAPQLAFYASTHKQNISRSQLSSDQIFVARRYALLHWRFFDKFVTEEGHWLAPDNFQELPEPVVAWRTSPTNIGMQLMSTVSAYDFGFITEKACVTMIERVLNTLDQLPKHRGHLFNWIEIKELRVLHPPYVSSVDSGNLCAALIAVNRALLELAQRGAVVASKRQTCAAILTALHIVLRLMGTSLERRELPSLRQHVKDCVSMLSDYCGSAEADTDALKREHAELHRRVLAKLTMAQSLLRTQPSRAVESEVTYWIDWATTLGKSVLTASTGGERLEDRFVRLTASDWATRAVPSNSQTDDGNDVLDEDGGGTDGGGSSGGGGGGGTDGDGDGTGAGSRFERLQRLAARCEAMALAMDFKFLYDSTKKLFSIGYDDSIGKVDRSAYDLLASESRTTSVVAIAKGDVPVEHWFRLGRTLVSRGDALISWSGTMFEYLMPMILLESIPNTLLDRCHRAVVSYQMDYTRRVFGQEKVPWGMSESGYNTQDQIGNYQYRAFGIPVLALKRGQDKDYVVAPYATMLSLPLMPVESMDNLALFEKMGCLGPYGFHDAVDFSRPLAYSEHAIVYNYMAHHIGMSLTTLDNVLNHRVWQRRFNAHPMVASCELLLHERVPRLPVTIEESDATHDPSVVADAGHEASHETLTQRLPAKTPRPQALIIGTVSFATVISNAGSGWSFNDKVAMTRWRNDATAEEYGQWIYIKDVSADKLFSASHLPVCAPYDSYDAHFSIDGALFQRRDGDLSTWMRCTVSTVHRADVRLVTIKNFGRTAKTVDIVSYAEVVLQSMAGDRQHPAFGNLFVETEWNPELNTILAKRRPRSAKQAAVYCVQTMALGRHTRKLQTVRFETSREKFLGRGRSCRSPAALDTADGLTNTAGSVLDPIVAMHIRVLIPPDGIAQVAFTTVLGSSLSEMEERADYYSNLQNVKQTFTITSSEMKEELEDLGVSTRKAMQFQQLFSHLLYRNPSYGSPEKLFKVTQGQEGLWSQGISGDVPICLVLVDAEEGLATVSQMLLAHRYWRRKGVALDLVIVNTQPATYLQDLQDRLLSIVNTWSDQMWIDKMGGVFLRRKNMIPEPVFELLLAVAPLVLYADAQELTEERFQVVDKNYADILAVEPWKPKGDHATFSQSVTRSISTFDLIATVRSEQIAGMSSVQDGSDKVGGSGSGLSGGCDESCEEVSAETARGAILDRVPDEPLERSGARKLAMFNGYGGLDTATNSYVVEIVDKVLPPTPWINVIAGPRGGTLVSESGGGYSWTENSFFFRLTPWRNDYVTDAPSEAIYLRNDETGEVWSPTPAPVMHDSLYRVTHRAGSTSYEHEHSGVRTLLEVTVASEGALKVQVLSVRNRTNEALTFTVSWYVEWVLGQLREQAQQSVITFFDNASQSLCARNPYESHFGRRVGFAWCSGYLNGFTCDRREFLGRCGSLADPHGLKAAYLLEQTGAGLDPCAVRQVSLAVPAGGEMSVVFLLGSVGDVSEIPAMIRPYSTPARAVDAALDVAQREWATRLGTIECRTPSASFDAMVNHWTLYQALSCRYWGRTALYQSGGGIGFRDQLQDVMALLYAEPKIAREHILRCSSRQFPEGDVQHWWHLHSGRGVRTRISDDLVWLPYVAATYVHVTGDEGIWEESQPFLEMRTLQPHEEDVYDLPRVSEQKGTLYEHCVRALEHASTFGEHGLPLIGTGDWNDGMNNVGHEGRGESVWLAWFLIAAMRLMIDVARKRGDHAHAEQWAALCERYAQAADNSWDGEWYRRAYFDDGTPLGTREAKECMIDSISQTWSVISGGGTAERSALAVEAAEKHLVMPDAKVIKLLTPPFDQGDPNPGYIQGYVPGVRENGAQYTHSSAWMCLANAQLHRGNRAFELLQYINPLSHGDSRQMVDVYRGEPYVIAADIYTARNLVGRCGWTWYTGSASWFYRTAVEAVLGLKKQGERLTLDPCIPEAWEEFEVTYRRQRCTYAISIRNPRRVQHGVKSLTVDGVEAPDLVVHLDRCTDTTEHRHVVRVDMV